MVRVMSLPLTLSWTLTAPGPMGVTLLSLPAASATVSSGAVARAVAAAAAPEPRRKARRGKPLPFWLFSCGSFIAWDPPLVSCRTEAEGGAAYLAGLHPRFDLLVPAIVRG